jgi:hypothetical protein
MRKPLSYLLRSVPATRVARVRSQFAAGLRPLYVVFLFTYFAHATAAEYEADAVKAAFLHRFAAYVEWPNLPPRDAPFTIAVIDDDGLVSHLERLLPGLKIHDRRAQVRSISSAAELDGVQILYIGPDHAARTKALVQAAANRPVLLVTDQPQGLANGSIINFVQVSRNVRFEVSLSAARRHGLQINAGLLSVAVRVEDGPRSGLGGDGDTLRLVQKPNGPSPIPLQSLRWLAVTDADSRAFDRAM